MFTLAGEPTVRGREDSNLGPVAGGSGRRLGLAVLGAALAGGGEGCTGGRRLGGRCVAAPSARTAFLAWSSMGLVRTGLPSGSFRMKSNSYCSVSWALLGRTGGARAWAVRGTPANPWSSAIPASCFRVKVSPVTAGALITA